MYAAKIRWKNFFGIIIKLPRVHYDSVAAIKECRSVEWYVGCLFMRFVRRELSRTEQHE